MYDHKYLMKKSAKIIALSISGIVALLFLLIIGNTSCVDSANRYVGFFEQLTWTDGRVQDEWQQADSLWSNGDFLGSTKKSLHALWATMDFGIRSTISQFYFCRAIILENQGQFMQAYYVCYKGAQVITKFDVGYVISTNCFSIGFRHNFINPNTVIEPDGTLINKP